MMFSLEVRVLNRLYAELKQDVYAAMMASNHLTHLVTTGGVKVLFVRLKSIAQNTSTR